MCMELIKFVTRASMLLPAIEEARPGCNSGIQVLCQLTRALVKAKDILQHCRESSKLYLVRIFTQSYGTSSVFFLFWVKYIFR